MFDKEAIERLTEAGSIRAAANALTDQVDTLVALPNHFNIHDVEKYLTQRRRACGTMATSVIADFAGYVKNHADIGATVFINQEEMAAVAVLNLGTPDVPGHADNRAKLQLKKTASYKAMLAATTGAITQVKAAEFFEDCPDALKFFRPGEDGLPVEVTPAKAIAAVRKITIEALARMGSEQQQLSATRTAFESVSVKNDDPIPTTIHFTCAPYHGLATRQFVLRLSISTGHKEPTILLRVVNTEKHDEEMAVELANLVQGAITEVPVLIGGYSAGA